MEITQVGMVALVLISALSGLVVGAGTVFNFMSRLVRDQKATDSAEKLLHAGVPQETLNEVSALAKQGMDLADKYGEKMVQMSKDFFTFVRNVTDGQPNVFEVTEDDKTSS